MNVTFRFPKLAQLTSKFFTSFLGVSLMTANQTYAETQPAKSVQPLPFAYEIQGEKFEGVLAEPTFDAKNKNATKKPAILFLPNWMGITKDTAAEVQRYSDLGFIVLAADVYGAGNRPTQGKEAGAFAGKYKSDRKLFRERVTSALQKLKDRPLVDPNLIFAVGYCFGGTGVIELARAGANIKGVVSFHGGLDSPTPDNGKKIVTKVLALHGADDPFVSAKDLTEFEDEMRKAKVDWQLFKYGNAVHSFTDKNAGNDNSKGAAYNQLADERSWSQAVRFFSESGVNFGALR